MRPNGPFRTAKALGCTVATVESCMAGALACLLADAEGRRRRDPIVD
jgi:nicotinamide mononucleotide (NMN) deamidase PncC